MCEGNATSERCAESPPEITFFRKKDVVNKLLGITIVKGKPTALDFQHNAVALQRTVVVAMQINCVFIHMIWR